MESNSHSAKCLDRPRPRLVVARVAAVAIAALAGAAAVQDEPAARSLSQSAIGVAWSAPLAGAAAVQDEPAARSLSQSAIGVAWSAPLAGAAADQDEPAARLFVPLALAGFSGPFDSPVVVPPATETPVPTATPTDEPTEEPTPTRTPRPQPSPTKPTGPDWLIYFNQRRALAKMPPASENPVFSRGDALHAKYMVKNDYIGHSEDPSKPYYTAEGLAAAQNGDVAVHSKLNWNYQGPINLWMTGPFHLLPLISPLLSTTGFGQYSEAGHSFQSGAVMEWQRGRLETVPSAVKFPIRFPENGEIMPFFSHDGNEAPSPLTSCPGYAAPVGAPIELQLGTGDATPKVTKTSLMSGNTALAHCWFDETTYKNSNATYQQIGRGALKMANAVVIMAKEPLKPNTDYTVSIVSNGTNYQWSFRTAAESAPILFDAPPSGRPAWMSLLR